MITKRLSTLFSLLILNAIALQSAVAGEPLKENFQLSFTDAVVGLTCTSFGYDFDIWADAVFDVTRISFFGKDGSLERMRIHSNLSDAVYKNSTDKTKALDLGPGWTENDWIELRTGETVVSGGFNHLTVPGYGIIALGAGRLVFSSDGSIVWRAGRADLQDNNLAVLCGLLA